MAFYVSSSIATISWSDAAFVLFSYNEYNFNVADVSLGDVDTLHDPPRMVHFLICCPRELCPRQHQLACGLDCKQTIDYFTTHTQFEVI